MSVKVGVIGAGVSGLATAYRLRGALREAGVEHSLRIYERASRPGGAIYSAREDGFLIEWGPNGFLNNEPATIRLVDDLGIRSSLLKSSDAARRRFILIGGRLREVPAKPPQFLTSDIITLGGKLRFAVEPFIRKRPAEQGDESVADFVRRRFGRQALERMFDPLMSGVYAGDVARLSVNSALSTFAELEAEYGGVVRGMIKRMRERRRELKENPPAEGGIITTSKNPMLGTLYSFRDGMGELIGALADELSDDLRLEAAIETIEPAENGYLLRGRHRDAELTERYDVVILAAPPTAAARSVASLNAEMPKVLAGVEASPMVVIALGFEVAQFEHDLSGFGYLIPRKEGMRSLGCLWSSSIFDHRADDGRALLTVMIGGAHDHAAVDAADDELIDTALHEFRDLLGLRGEPLMTRVIKHRTGIPQYNVGHGERVARLEEIATNLPGFYLAGNGYYGISANDCIKRSEFLAAEAAAFLIGN